MCFPFHFEWHGLLILYQSEVNHQSKEEVHPEYSATVKEYVLISTEPFTANIEKGQNGIILAIFHVFRQADNLFWK